MWAQKVDYPDQPVQRNVQKSQLHSQNHDPNFIQPHNANEAGGPHDAGRRSGSHSRHTLEPNSNKAQ